MICISIIKENVYNVFYDDNIVIIERSYCITTLFVIILMYVTKFFLIFSNMYLLKIKNS